MSAEDLHSECLKPWLKTAFTGRRCLYAPIFPSTNAELKDRAGSLPEGTLCFCDAQSAGRGRSNHLWHSPCGVNLYFSVLLCPPAADGRRLPQLAMLAALALHRTLRTLLPAMEVSLKWPNDLWIGCRKISGILCEVAGRRPDGAIPVVVGVGLNVNSAAADFPPELRESAGSLAICTGGARFNRAEILAHFLNCLEEIYLQWRSSDDFSPFIAEWQRYDLLNGRTIAVEHPAGMIRGTVCGLSAGGSLLLRREGQGENMPPEEILAGDIHILRESIAP